ncbi:PREDICTED: uncharacterized protein LOC105571148 [Vollenhovia emeryi]|uniref:uncharacterized protein LOC105571148 n=1 Tax=Vollenhovia emeryi TaxID=411798 RepID=UPI0005F58AC9|nr:PREDICTED: uncharacterized protein LOC105571148 [Vollenhovia emeryi]
MAFHVVEFRDGLGLIPSNWMTENKTVCFYPTGYSKSEMNKAVKASLQPALKNTAAKWILCDIVRYFASADTFEKGMDKLKLAEKASDLDTDVEDTLKRSRHSRHVVDMELSDDDECSKKVALDKFPDINLFSDNVPDLTMSSTSASLDTNVIATYECPVINSSSSNEKMCHTESKNSCLETRVRRKFSSLVEKESCSDEKNKVPDYTIKKTSSDINILSEIVRKQNKILLEIKAMKEQIAELRSTIISTSYDTCTATNKNNSHTFKATNMGNVDGKKLFIENLEELQDLETALANEDFFQRAGEALCCIGGSDVNRITRNVLFALLSNKVAMQFSWAGREKKAFNGLNITKLIKAVVSSQKVDTKPQEIEGIINKWLIQATLRFKREKSKEEKQTISEKDDNSNSS